MPNKKFRWTRRRYRKAHSLARLASRHLYDLSEQPPLVRLYLDLWNEHREHGDPLLTPVRVRLMYRRNEDDDIPF